VSTTRHNIRHHQKKPNRPRGRDGKPTGLRRSPLRSSSARQPSRRIGKIFIRGVDMRKTLTAALFVFMIFLGFGAAQAELIASYSDGPGTFNPVSLASATAIFNNNVTPASSRTFGAADIVSFSLATGGASYQGTSYSGFIRLKRTFRCEARGALQSLGYNVIKKETSHTEA
jgi:hypothetical protein